MTEWRLADHQWNPGKLATIGLLMVMATAFLTGVVVAHYAATDTRIPTALLTSTLPEQTGRPPALRSPPTPAAPAQRVSVVPPDPHAAATYRACMQQRGYSD